MSRLPVALDTSSFYWDVTALSGVVAPSGGRYRHVVFTAAVPRRPLNLGAPSCTSFIPELPPITRSDEIDVSCNDDRFLSWLLSEGGQSALDYRPTSLRRRLPACLRALRVKSTTDARRLLRRSPHLVPIALDALILGVTEFFRDAPVFSHLADHLPSLLETSGGCLRIWSVGCSKGAELYSVAILLAELNALENCELLGTDCREDAITRAQAGRYSPTTLRGVSPERLARYFSGPAADAADAAGGMTLSTSLRNQVTWRRSDALAGVESGPWDIILCRNFAMYLQPQAAESLWRGLVSVLKPGGLLILGKAERVASSLGLVPAGPCVYRRYGEP